MLENYPVLMSWIPSSLAMTNTLLQREGGGFDYFSLSPSAPVQTISALDNLYPGWELIPKKEKGSECMVKLSAIKGTKKRVVGEAEKTVMAKSYRIQEYSACLNKNVQ